MSAKWISTLPAIWKWEFNSEWIGYNVESCKEIEKAYQNDQKTIVLKSKKWEYVLNFSEMIQTNKSTKTARLIKRCLDNYAFWYFESGYKTFSRFDPEIEVQLEKIFIKFQDCVENDKYLWIDENAHELVADIGLMQVTSSNNNKIKKIKRWVVNTTVSNMCQIAEPNDQNGVNQLTKPRIQMDLNVLNDSTEFTRNESIQLKTSILTHSQNSLLQMIFNFGRVNSSKNRISQITAEILNDCNIRLNEAKVILEQGVVYCNGLSWQLSEKEQLKYFVKVNPQNDECAICLDKLTSDVVRLSKCTHCFHLECIELYLQHGRKPGLVCPKCNIIQYKGNGPSPKGSMIWTIVSGSLLDGYPNVGTIIIRYFIPKGLQSSRHLNPKKPFTGTIRYAYLPYNKQGVLVFELLKQSFEGGHTFTVGTSVSSGRSNVVVWNGIHHKTNRSGGTLFYGYPDPTYFERVLSELKEKGITPCDKEMESEVKD